MTATAARTVLIVDDHEVNRRILSLFLQPLGWRATMAANGSEAVEAASVASFDLILMDRLMPVMDGIAATHAIRSAPGPNRETPIIAVTGLDERADWLACGVSDYLAKPVQPERLMAAVESALKKTRLRISA